MYGGLDPLAFEAKSHRFGGGFFHFGLALLQRIGWRTDCFERAVARVLRNCDETSSTGVKP